MRVGWVEGGERGRGGGEREGEEEGGSRFDFWLVDLSVYWYNTSNLIILVKLKLSPKPLIFKY